MKLSDILSMKIYCSGSRLTHRLYFMAHLELERLISPKNSQIFASTSSLHQGVIT